MLSLIVAGVICLVQSKAEDNIANATISQEPSVDNVKPSTTVHPAEIVRLDLDSAATHFLPISFQDIELGSSNPIGEEEVRERRSSPRNNEDYDDKYNRFMQSFNNRKARGNYRVEDNDDDSDADEEEENEEEEDSASEEQPKKGKKGKSARTQTAGSGDEDFDRIKEESQKAKKSKHCRVEKRGNMFCNVCYNPKNGDSAESCSFRTDPHEKKYAFSKEKKYRSKDGEPEKQREFVTQRPYYARPAQRAPTAYARPIPAPYRRPSLTMGYVPRYGYVFAPNRRPPAPPSRPVPQRSTAYGKSVPKRYIYAGQESRPQREVVGVANKDESKNDSLEDAFNEKENEQIIQLKKNHTNEEPDFHPKFDVKDGVDKILADFKAKDWSKCEHSTKGDLNCYTCVNSKGSKQEECVYDSGSENNGKPYYSELKSFRETAFGDNLDEDNYFDNKPKKNKKSPPKKVTTKKPTVESNTMGNYNIKSTFGEVEDHLTPEADLFPWDTTGPSPKQAKRMVATTYRKENRNPDESRVTVFGHKVIHSV